MNESPRRLDHPPIQVVLATYNGALYLDAQIASILEQLGNGQLLIHDDGSSDGTQALLSQWVNQDPRVRVLSGPPQGGASANFSYLLERTTAPYVFCADQDDIWKPEKLSTLLKVMKFYEGVYGNEVPLLVHSDLSLIDGDGQLIAESMWSYQKLNPRWGDRFNLLLTQNVVTGCAMLVNRALLDRALPVPPGVSMHDHWLALVACAQGKVIWVDEPTVLYRQHEKNVVGAYKYNPYSSIERFGRIIRGQEDLRIVSFDSQTSYDNAKNYIDRFPVGYASEIAWKFLGLQNCSIVARPFLIIRNKFFFSSTLYTLSWAIQPRKIMAKVLGFMEMKANGN